MVSITANKSTEKSTYKGSVTVRLLLFKCWNFVRLSIFDLHHTLCIWLYFINSKLLSMQASVFWAAHTRSAGYIFPRQANTTLFTHLQMKPLLIGNHN